jgi:amidohydrolase
MPVVRFCRRGICLDEFKRQAGFKGHSSHVDNEEAQADGNILPAVFFGPGNPMNAVTHNDYTETWRRMEVTENVGGTGVVGVLPNGDGATVLLRADMDALPMKESTGLPYAGDKTGTDRFDQATSIAHACGHDMHVAWMMGATRILAENRDTWRGTVMAVFQPGEETAQGARAMVEDGMVKGFPKPDGSLGQHLMPLSAGQIGYHSGTMLSAGDSWEVTLFGRGAHGSMPEKSIDPVVMAAATVMRLQTVVSREVAMSDGAVVTVGILRAGNSDNVIPDHALLRLNVRTFKEQVRDRALSAIKRVLEAEASASGDLKPPERSVLGEWPLTNHGRDRHAQGGGRLRAPVRRRGRGGARGTHLRQRGLQPLRRRVGRARGVLGSRRRRPGHVQEGRGGRQAGRVAGQPLPGLRAHH